MPPQYGPKENVPVTAVAPLPSEHLVIGVCELGLEVLLAGLVDFIVALAPHSISSS